MNGRSSGTRWPLNPSPNQPPASSAISSASVVSATGPWPSVVRSSVASWISTRRPSAVRRMSVSTYCAPSATACSNAANVFSGASAEDPRWPPTRNPTPLARQSTLTLGGIVRAAHAGAIDLDPLAGRGIEQEQVRALHGDRRDITRLKGCSLLGGHQRTDRAGADLEVDEEVPAERLREGDRRLDLARADRDVLGANADEEARPARARDGCDDAPGEVFVGTIGPPDVDRG